MKLSSVFLPTPIYGWESNTWTCQLHIVSWIIFITYIMHNWMKYYRILWCSYVLLDSWIYRCADPQNPVFLHPCMGEQILRSQYLYICRSTDPWILKSLYPCIDRSSTSIDPWVCICLYIHSSMNIWCLDSYIHRFPYHQILVCRDPTDFSICTSTDLQTMMRTFSSLLFYIGSCKYPPPHIPFHL